MRATECLYGPFAALHKLLQLRATYVIGKLARYLTVSSSMDLFYFGTEIKRHRIRDRRRIRIDSFNNCILRQNLFTITKRN